MSIGKRLIIIFLSSFFGITAVPDVLVSADYAPITDVRFAQASEVVEAPVKTEAIQTAKEVTKPTQPKNTNVTSKTNTSNNHTSVSDATVPAKVPNQITIAGRTIPIVVSNDLKADAGNKTIFAYGRLLFGHNSSMVFGNLKNLNIRDTFVITMNNVTSTYRIDYRVIYNYVSTPDGRGKLRLDGDDTDDYMNRLYLPKNGKAKDDKGVYHDLAIMTCHGASLGNGNAAQRLVLFANKI